MSNSPFPLRFGPQNLLEYDARFGVLICLSCHYAIQKSALQSHLLRHKIYRSDRHELLRQIAPLQLLEPHLVPLPPASAAPVSSLPVIEGFRCTAPGCGCLYASTKRMKRHQSEVHGREDVGNLETYSRPARMQTFFRGTKLRYFEVTVAATATASQEGTGELDIDADGDVTISYTDEPEAEPEPQPDVNVSIAHGGLPRPDHGSNTRTSPRSSSLSLAVDLDALACFHHFLAAASLVLPTPEGQGQGHGLGYWQTDVVRRALQHRWLMCGLLAIAAAHVASETDDVAMARANRARSSECFAEFSAGWDEAIALDQEIVLAARQIRYVLCCARWGWEETTESIPELQDMLSTVRGFAGSEFALPFDGATSSHGTATFDCLHMLPSRMADTFGKPDDVRDALASLSAIAALVDCCEGNQLLASAWDAMIGWLTKLPDHFSALVVRKDPAALVVVAHWAALLVAHVERSGCWFFRGLSSTMLRVIVASIPANNVVVRRLISSLMV